MSAKGNSIVSWWLSLVACGDGRDRHDQSSPCSYYSSSCLALCCLPFTVRLQSDNSNIDDKEDVTSSTTRIAFMTFSHLANLDSFQHYLILPSLETWLYTERGCTLLCRVLSNHWETQYNKFCQGVSSPFPSDFCQRISPIFVDLSCYIHSGAIQSVLQTGVWFKSITNIWQTRFYDWFLCICARWRQLLSCFTLGRRFCKQLEPSSPKNWYVYSHHVGCILLSQKRDSLGSESGYILLFERKINPTTICSHPWDTFFWSEGILTNYYIKGI